MSTNTAAPGRVSKREFIARTAQRAGVPSTVTTAVYEALIEEILAVVGEGRSLTLTGFGRFYPQEHRGHSVRFSNGPDGEGRIGDYRVLKFSATRDTNRRLGPH